MTTYYKAVRPDGTDFRTGTIDYAAALASGGTVKHPHPGDPLTGGAEGYLSAATVATDCTGMLWPCRLFEVEPVGVQWVPDAYGLPHKVACHALKVVRELPAHEALGPQGEHVVELIERVDALTLADARRVYSVRAAASTIGYVAAMAAAIHAATHAAGRAAESAAINAALNAARRAAKGAARDAAWEVARALAVRDLIGQYGFTREHYDTLTGPWRQVIGPIHPDDEPIGPDL